VIRLGQKMTYGFFTLPVAFDVVPMIVEPAASVTMSEYIWIMVLEGFLRHAGVILYRASFYLSKAGCMTCFTGWK
jgi:hypothetical protein